ncbi:UDP-4-amino-4,6-dideoxy-N-acetyl-beta-L-altrosamine N-acetyltransferase [Helicobacter sp. 13S00401-1]|nr:UDP-4-amino-4,6-dideoxy-N-acetyl-beta-L-altrosamine N-acetyltransferase [Helicobacter sp. 13S00401-1]
MQAKPFSDLDDKDIALTLEYRNHPFVRKHMYEDNLISMKTHLNFIHAQRDNLSSRYFLVSDKTRHLGVTSLTRINLKHKNAYLGIYKNPYLKNHLGSKLLDMICFIAKELGLYMLFLEVIEDNLSAIRLYEKYGFKRMGKLEAAFYQEASFKNVLIYGIGIN